MIHSVAFFVFLTASLISLTPGQADEVQFSSDVAPILASRCLGCHNNRISEGRYALDTLDRLLTPGDSEEPIVVPGKPEESQLYLRIIEEDSDLRMPQEDDRLDRSDVDAIRSWIMNGADFGDASRESSLTDVLPPRTHPAAPRTYRLPIPVFAVALSPGAKSVITGGWHELLVWESETGHLTNRVGRMPQRIHAIEYSLDSQLVVVAGGAPGDYGEIQIHAADALARSAAHPVVISDWNDLVLDVSFSPDGRFLVACGADNSVRCYSLDGKERWRTRQHVDWVTAAGITEYSFFESRIPNDKGSSLFTFTEFEEKSKEHPRQFWEFSESHCIVREANWELELRSTPAKQTNSLTRITISGIGKTYRVEREQIPDAELNTYSDVLEYLTALAERLREGSALSEGRVRFPQSQFVVSSSYDRTARVFALETGRLFTTYKGHRREYGPLKGLHRVLDVLPEAGSRRVWSAGEGQHIHGWNPVVVRDEDGTAADMEQRFSKEYSTDLLKHELSAPIFRITRSHDQLIAATGDGLMQSIRAFGQNAKYSLQYAADSKQLRAADGTPRYDMAIDKTSGRIATVGGNGILTIQKADGAVLRQFVAAPLREPEQGGKE